ncbi:MAG: ribonuclease P protein component [Patescibacteria group bacterium]
MFLSVNRLRNDTDIKTLFSRGKSVFDNALGMKFRKNQLPDSRFTVVVGIKVSKKAVVRNRLKRRIRAIVEKQIPMMKKGFDIMFLVKKETIDLTPLELEEQILHVFKRAKLL